LAGGGRGALEEVVGELAEGVATGEEGEGEVAEDEVVFAGEGEGVEVVEVVDEAVVGSRGVEEDEREVLKGVFFGFEVEGEFHVGCFFFI